MLHSQTELTRDLPELPTERAPAPMEDPPALMEVLADLLGAEVVVLTMHPSDGEPSCVASCGANPDPAIAVTLSLGNALVRRPSLAEAEWRDAVAPYGRCLLIPLEEVPGHSPLVLGLYFRAPTTEQCRRAEAYVSRRPFADGCFDLWQLSRLRARRCAALEEAVDRSDDGLVLVSRNADVLFENDAARALIDLGDGLRRVKGALRAANLADSVNLQMSIEHVIAAALAGDCSGQEGQVLALRRRVGPPLLAVILPSRMPPLEPTDVAAAVYLACPKRDPGRALLPVCQLYGLSPVETNLVGHLVAGRTLGVAAQMMKVKEHTARGYLKNIFYKTSTNRQTEIVALMLGSLVSVKQSVLRNYGFSGFRQA